jgi:hypothetical protein
MSHIRSRERGNLLKELHERGGFGIVPHGLEQLDVDGRRMVLGLCGRLGHEVCTA